MDLWFSPPMRPQNSLTPSLLIPGGVAPSMLCDLFWTLESTDFHTLQCHGKQPRISLVLMFILERSKHSYICQDPYRKPKRYLNG